jgi:ring-1,2-phenylacetyl-CoA epoxidase subunit PaaD
MVMTSTGSLTAEARIWGALEAVSDPEIPVVSVVELGIVQSIAVEGDAVRVTITPTFLGCPALELMREEIAGAVRRLGYETVIVDVSLSPPWTSDRIAAPAREKMRRIGLAAPAARFRPDSALELAPASIATAVPCPFCGSQDTSLESAFGPTICRAIHYCRACRQSFEEFKAI